MRTLGILATSASLLTAAVLAALPSTATAAPRDDGKTPSGEWDVTVVDPDQSFRGLDAVNRRTAWVTGGSVSEGPGRVFRTRDAGRTWQDVTPPGTTGLRFRDVEARSARNAVSRSASAAPANARVTR